jgi:MYXO-CTERM domain-containing protein
MTAGPGNGEVLVCSVGERAASPWPLLALAAVFGLRRRT